MKVMNKIRVCQCGGPLALQAQPELGHDPLGACEGSGPLG